jgi:phosphonopyruvate decarboxylase
VGGQPTKGASISFSKVAKELGYQHTFEIESKEELTDICSNISELEGSVLITVKTRAGFRKNLGRPDRSPIDNKQDFMKFLSE